MLAMYACTLYDKALTFGMIISFGDQATEDIYNGVSTKAARTIPSATWHIAIRKLDMINAAHDLKDLRVPPANRLELINDTRSKLRGIHDANIIFFAASGGELTLSD
jgi:toxin HigB-1